MEKQIRILASPVWLSVSVITFFLTGCTSVTDFKKMSPDERAKKVCLNQKIIKNYSRQIELNQSKVADSQAALDKGYRVHQQCEQVKFYGDAATTCSTLGDFVNCQTSRPTSYETRCNESPVSINPDLERSNIAQRLQTVASLKEAARHELQRCYQAVYRMSPEDAYKYY